MRFKLACCRLVFIALAVELVSVIFAAVICCARASANPETIYSNLAQGRNKYAGTVWQEYGIPPFQDVLSFGFTSPGNYIVTSVQVAAFVAKNISKAHVFTFVIANGQKNPDQPLYQTQIKKFPPPRCCRKVVTVDIPANQGPMLQQGKRYWIELIASTKTDGSWAWNSTNARGISRISYDYGKTWQRSGVGNHPNGAFAVYGTPVD